MNANTGRIKSLFQLQHAYGDMLAQQRAETLLRLALTEAAFVILGLASVFVRGLSPERTILFVAIAAISAVSGILVYSSVNRGGYIQASLIYIVLLFVRAALAGLPDNPTQIVSPLILIYSMPIIAAGILLNQRATYVMVVLTSIAVALTILLNSNTLLLSNIETMPLGLAVVFNIVVLAADGFMISIFVRGQRTLARTASQLGEGIQSTVAMSRGIVETAKLDDLFNQAINAIRGHMGFYYAQVFVVEAKTGLIVQQASFQGRSRVATDLRRIAPDMDSIINDVIRSGKARYVGMNGSASEKAEFLPGTQAELLIPLKRGQDILGVLDIQALQADQFNERVNEVLEAIAAQLASAVQNIRLSSELENTERERKRLAEQLTIANQEVERLASEANRSAWSRYFEGRSETGIGFDWKEGVAVPNTALTPTLERGLDNPMPDIYVQKGEKVMSVPILSRGQLLGTMEFRAPANQDWNNRSVELARVIAQRLALALDNIRLYEQAQLVANREQVANQVAARLQSKTDIDSLLMVAAESFQEALGATRASIRLSTPDLLTSKTGDGKNQ